MKPYTLLYMSEETGFKWVVWDDYFETDNEAKSIAREWKAKHSSLSSICVVKIIADDTFMQNI